MQLNFKLHHQVNFGEEVHLRLQGTILIDLPMQCQDENTWQASLQIIEPKEPLLAYSYCVYRDGKQVFVEPKRFSHYVPLNQSANEVLKSVPVSGGEFVNYYQTNYSNPYGTDGGTIATSGCGPTAMAMVLTYLTGDEITPVETAEYDVECTQTGVSEENIISALEDDKPVIMSMGPGTFTRGGHFIVLTGLNDDGTISVADPNSEVRSQTNYDIDVFLNEGKGMWSFC